MPEPVPGERENGVPSALRGGRVPVRAFFLGERIDTRGLDGEDVVSRAPLTFRISEEGFAVVFRYGAVVFFDVAPTAEEHFRDRISAKVRNPFPEPTEEFVEVLVEEGVPEDMRGDTIVLPERNLLYWHVIADVMGKSVVLDSYEKRVAKGFDAIEPIARRLKTRGFLSVRTGSLLQHIGEALIDQQYMVWRVEVAEKPDFLWEHSFLERFYARLEDEFEIRERHAAVERKLELISGTARTVLDVVQTKRTLRVEWYIVLLIVVEIVLTLYDLFLKPGH